MSETIQEKAPEVGNKYWSYSGPVALLVAFAAVIVPAAIVLFPSGNSSAEDYARGLLTGWGIAAAVLATVASLLRMLAHNGNRDMDGFGKMLGFNASFLALCATSALAWLSSL